MIAETKWLVPGRILVFRHTGIHTLKDLEESMNISKVEVTEHGTPPYTHIIHDLTSGVELDKSLFSLRAVQALMPSKSEMNNAVGWMTVADPHPNPVMNMIISIITQTMNVRFRVFTALEPTIAFLYDRDATLPPRPVALEQNTDAPTSP